MPIVPLRSALALLVVAGCGGDACDRLWYADRDGDGHGDRDHHRRACEAPRGAVQAADDCDDADPAIHPGAPEVCDGIDQDCDGVIDPGERTWYADADHDGYGTTLLPIRACAAPPGFTDLPGDCDDGDRDTHPGAPVERCDGRDQDCDGLIDEGAPGDELWAPDEDLDGQGDVTGAQLVCAPPPGWVSNTWDCDDLRSVVGIGLPEWCDGLDNDCDGQIDEASDAIGAWLWFRDADGDAFGDLTVQVVACAPPPGFVGVDGDCDDDDATISPISPEVCNGGVDDDCDAVADEDDPSLDPGTLAAGWLDQDRDALGDPSAPIDACVLGEGVVGNDDDCDDLDRWVGADSWLDDLDGDGVGAGTPVAGASCAPPAAGMANVAAGGDCDEADPLVRPRVPDRCGDHVDQDCSGVDPSCRPALTGLDPLSQVSRAWVSGTAATDALGASIGAAGDLDGDGLPDVVLGAPGAGAATIVLGPMPEAPWPALATRTVLGVGIGSAVALAGTANGGAELVLGAPDDGAGVVYVLADGGAAGTVAAARLTVTGALVGERTGAAVTALPDGDADGDGELAVGSPGVPFGLARVFLVGLEHAGVVPASGAELVVTGMGSLGSRLAGLDADGDGQPELAAAAPTATDAGLQAGAVHLLPVTTGTFGVAAIELARITGAPGSSLGSALAAGGDLDGDGLDDLAAAAPADATVGAAAGRVFVFADPSGTSDAAATAVFLVDGDAAGAELGQSLAIGDLDGDGADDLILGVEGADLAGADGGAVYAFYGPLSGAARAAEADAILHGAAGERAGAALAIGDADGDGLDDLWVGSATGPGLAWWVPGP